MGLPKCLTNPEGHPFAEIKASGETKSNQVLPAGPTVELPEERALAAKDGENLSFAEAFGLLGAPMLSILAVCSVWTAWLIFVALAPNAAANLLMNTESYDRGQFWLILDTNPGMARAGAVGLVVVGLSYLYVILKMLLWREKVFASAVLKQLEQRLDTLTPSAWRSCSWTSIIGSSYRRGRHLWVDLTAFKGSRRKFWARFDNVFLKLIDLGLEMIVLPVGYPIVTLVYCYFNFDFDREVYLTYLEVLPLGSFEHLARMFADQSEIALFHLSFDSLRITSVQDFVLRISLNLSFCYRFKRVVEVLVWTRYHERVSRRTRRRGSSSSVPAAQKSVPRGVAVVFIAFSVGVLMAAHEAVTDSKALCSVYPECVVYAHRWRTSDGFCPCLFLIDADRTPMTYDQWIHPVDAYDKVKALAASGKLKSLQVINRQLLGWPEELRTCRYLKTMYVPPVLYLLLSSALTLSASMANRDLIYTSTESVPAWTKEFKYLETFHIEGKQGSRNLLTLPEDLFSDMPRLATIHFAVHENLSHFPALTGVPYLQSLAIVWMFQLHVVPSFEHVPGLQKLFLAYLPVLERLPDMSPLGSLVEFNIVRPSNICCNGFQGSCDLSDFFCLGNPTEDIPAAACLKDETDPRQAVTPFLGSVGTAKAFETFASSICQRSPFDAVSYSNVPTKETIEVCDGKPFRQCSLPDTNSTGICYNTRMQVLACLADENYIALRRLQIEEGVGLRCDPVEEKWLGCAS
ncbi:hypothetical protein BBJ28_00002074 [Nothophytophthora sp. Chile5]|nr:hypothetical protein BBJ28_00002074 [Nothophytophthora sp. Chile5]